MALMDELKKQSEVAGATTEPVANDKKVERKEKNKARKAEKKDALTKLIDWVSTSNAPEDIKALANTLKPRAGGFAAGAFGPSVFNVIFGDTPKVGDKKTSLEVFELTCKGHAEMRRHCKKWAEKGNIVEFDEKQKAYVIKALA